MASLLNKIYLWLPIIFGCHCLENRSFHYKGKKFPLCARCTGELIGILFGGLIWVFFNLHTYIYIILMIPMMFDGFVQLFSSYTSTNIRRVITGFLFGYSLISIFIQSNIYVFNLGYSFFK